MCTRDHALTDIQSTNLGEMEREWLHLLRLHCISFEHNRADGLDRAIDHAEARYGADDGPAIASRIAVLIRAMRAERRGGFGYLSPFCPNCRRNVTDDECQLLTLMQAGYRGVPHEIEEAAAGVARRAEAPVLTAAAARFGKAVAAALCPGRAPPPARATLH
jgi:hypothetical protein